MPDNQPVSGGSPSERAPMVPAFGDEQLIDEVNNHLTMYVGEPNQVLHEIDSERVHIDIHIVPPQQDFDFYTLMTSGMSERPQTTTADFTRPLYTELMLCLPADWPLDQESLRDEMFYWPIRCLKHLARYPHEHGTFLYPSHTIPNGNPLTELGPGIDFKGILILRPILFDADFCTLSYKVKNAQNVTRKVEVLSVIPLYSEELDYKLKHGLDALIEHFEAIGLSELLDPERPNVCA